MLAIDIYGQLRNGDSAGSTCDELLVQELGRYYADQRHIVGIRKVAAPGRRPRPALAEQAGDRAGIEDVCGADRCFGEQFANIGGCVAGDESLRVGCTERLLLASNDLRRNDWLGDPLENVLFVKNAELVVRRKRIRERYDVLV